MLPSVDLAAVLDGLVRRHGAGILDDRARLFGLLRDYAPGALRDIRVLMAAFDAGVAERLRGAARPVPDAILSAETGTVVAASGCRPDLCRAAVETWAALDRSGQAPARPLPLPGALPPSAALMPGRITQPHPLPAVSSPTGGGGLMGWAAIAAGAVIVIMIVLRVLGHL